MKVRSRHFLLSGAVGGLLGFALMEALAASFEGTQGRSEGILRMAFYFCGFGLAVGAALGITEGMIIKDRHRKIYGLTTGLLLGGVGGFLGGAAGQAVYGLVPLRYEVASNVDIAVALDSSSSMKQLFFSGSDPWGRRRDAARNLADRLSSSDRLAVIDFDERSQVLFPLTRLDTPQARQAAKSAIDRIDDDGGTSLDAGLLSSIQELSRNRIAGRKQHVIFLTDGLGHYQSGAAARAAGQGIVIYTIGLGNDVDAALLTGIALQTGGKYYPVEDASDLVNVFENIFSQDILMAEMHGAEATGQQAELKTSPAILYLLRIISWALMGVAIGAGQGVRENTREDLRACALGGLIGGAVGGALFNPVSGLVMLGSGAVGRGLAEIVVGACIGGSMRLAQQQMVIASGKPTTTLLRVLPQKENQPSTPLAPVNPQPSSAACTSVPERPAGKPKATASPKTKAMPRLGQSEASRRSLASYQEECPDSARAMAMAYHSKEFSLSEIARHFGVCPSTVRRAAQENRPI